MAVVEVTDELRANLRRNIALAVFDDAELDQLIRRLEVINRRIGELIVTEGEAGDCAFVVYTGRCRVLKKNTAGKTLTLTSLGPGDIFGEQSLITDNKRSATVRASEDCVLLRLSKAVFDEVLDAHPGVRESLNRFVQNRTVIDFLRSATFLGNLPPRDLANLLARLKGRDFEVGSEIVRQGTDGKEMYVVVSGEVEVTQVSAGLKRTLVRLGPGQYFGERALIAHEPRSATVTCLTATHCLELSANDLAEILERSPQVRDDFIRRIDQYAVTEEMQRKFGIRPSMPHVRKQLAYDDRGVLAPPISLPSALLGQLPIADQKSQGENPPPLATPIRHQKLNLKPKRGKYPVVRQLDEMDCGPASLAMVSKYYGISISISRLRETANAGREGSSMYGLSVAAEKLGYATRAVRTDYNNLIQSQLPAIAHWKGYHYIVVFEVTAAQVTVGDPALGLLKIARPAFEQGWTGRLLLLNPTPKLEEVEPETTSLSRFLPLVVPYRGMLFEILLASLILNLLQLASPMITQAIVDRVLMFNDETLLKVMLIGMCLIAVFQTLTRLLRQYLLIHVSQKLKLQMSANLFRYLLRLPMKFFQSRRIGELMQRFQDNQRLQQVMTGQAIGVVLDMLMVVASTALMLYYNLRLTAVAVLPIPAYIALTLAFTPLLKRTHTQQVEQQARGSSTLIETLTAISAVKTGCAELSSQWKHENQLVKEANIEMKGARQWMQMSAISSAIQIIASTIVLWYGAVLVMRGELTIGQLMAFQGLIAMLIQPIMALLGVWNQLGEAVASLKRLNDLYETKPEYDVTAHMPDAPHLSGHVTFENVVFSYAPDGKHILNGINLEIPPGRKVALVGRSGSGKTTLAMLLQRFYSPTEGRILVDGIDIAKIEVHSYREQVGVVSQDSTLFSGTIRENISLADPDSPLDRIITYAKLANAHDFIMSFPLGYETVVGEAGIRLSGGQKQRICIARALLRDPRILIFDEATSALDTESEKVIQDNMKVMLAGRTSFVIAHRLSTVQDADQIIVLDDGMIVEQGTHRQLLALKGLYYYLASQQLNS